MKTTSDEGKSLAYKILTHWAIVIPIGLFIMIASSFGGQICNIIIKLALKYLLPAVYSNDVFQTASMYFWSGVPWIIIIPLCLIGRKNVYRPVMESVKEKSFLRFLLSFLAGILIGGGMNLIVALAAIFEGCIDISFVGFRPVSFILIFVCVFIQSSAEEIMCRGFLQVNLLGRYKLPWMAVLVNSGVFALLHITNPGVTFLAILNILLSGILFSMIFYYFDSIWVVFLAHTAWNFMQNIILGLPNSGLTVPYSVFKLGPKPANGFAYNVNFGIEGTILACIVLFVACVIVYFVGRLTTGKRFFGKTEEAVAGENEVSQ